MEYILTSEEVEALEQVSLNDLEVELLYQIYLENKLDTFKA